VSSTPSARRRATLESYTGVVDGPLFGLSVAFLLAWTLIAAVSDMPEAVRVLLWGLVIAAWIVFAADLVVRLVLTPQRWRWAARHPLEVLGVIIPPLYPFKVLTVITRDTFRLGSKGLLKTGQAVVIAATVLTWTCSVAVLQFEEGAPGASIKNFGDSVWWACVTVTSVGYGDYAPVTTPGRYVGGLLMFAGLALIGVITATVAAWIISLTSADPAQPQVVPLADTVDEALAMAEASKMHGANETSPAG
jgi:voltage-gated potassium channel